MSAIRKRREIVAEFFERLPAVRAMLAEDVQAAFDGDPAAQSTDETIFCYPGLLAITVQRLAHEFYKLEVPLLPRIMTEYAHGLTGIDIHPGAKLGRQILHRPRHGRGDRRDDGDRRQREDLPGRDAGRAGPGVRPTPARAETPSDHRGQRDDLRRRDDPRRRHGHRRRLHDRRQRLHHRQRAEVQSGQRRAAEAEIPRSPLAHAPIRAGFPDLTLC